MNGGKPYKYNAFANAKRYYITNTMVLAANPPETLQIQWFGAQLALKPYKYNGFGARSFRNLTTIMVLASNPLENVTNTMVLGPSRPETLQIQWFWGWQCKKHYKK